MVYAIYCVGQKQLSVHTNNMFVLFCKQRNAVGSQVAGDTVGDPLKDTSGPALNIGARRPDVDTRCRSAFPAPALHNTSLL